MKKLVVEIETKRRTDVGRFTAMRLYQSQSYEESETMKKGKEEAMWSRDGAGD